MLSGFQNKFNLDLNYMNKPNLPKWLIVTLIAVFILRIPTFFDPFHYGDEMIYLTLGNGVRQGITLYSLLHDNKPPLLYLIAAVSGNIFWFRVILAFWNLTTIYFFWKLARKLFAKNSSVQKVATIFFAVFTTIPLFEGNIANAELFMILPTLLAFLILLSEKLTFSKVFLSGTIFAVSALFKIPSAFDAFTVIFFWLIVNNLSFKNLKKILFNCLVFALGFTSVILVTFIWYYFAGALKEYVIAAFLQNVGYLSSWRPDDTTQPFYIKNAPLLIRFGVVLFGSAILYLRRQHLSREFVFITLWLMLALFGATLSERPYPHYIIQVIPAISLLVGILVASKKMEQIYAIIPLGVAVFAFSYFNFWHYPTLPYYSNFINFATGAIDRSEYFNTFNSYTNRNYKIAQIVNSNTGEQDRVFVWGSDGSIYALSRRLPPIKYVADYHIKDFYSQKDTILKLRSNPPKIIAILPEADSFPALNNFVNDNYLLLGNINSASIWKRFIK
jgi:hypothetical protein